MKEVTISCMIRILKYEELNEKEKFLIEAAKKATLQSYAPYSRFAVGAAALLKNGITITGSNQENAAYPSGLCAERTALFYANSQYPDIAIQTLAIAARNETGYLPLPISPCGACRQVLLEIEQRYRHPIHILLYGEKEIYSIDGIKNLLPLSFGKDLLISPSDK